MPLPHGLRRLLVALAAEKIVSERETFLPHRLPHPASRFRMTAAPGKKVKQRFSAAGEIPVAVPEAHARDRAGAAACRGVSHARPAFGRVHKKRHDTGPPARSERQSVFRPGIGARERHGRKTAFQNTGKLRFHGYLLAAASAARRGFSERATPVIPLSGGRLRTFPEYPFLSLRGKQQRMSASAPADKRLRENRERRRPAEQKNRRISGWRDWPATCSGGNFCLSESWPPRAREEEREQ